MRTANGHTHTLGRRVSRHAVLHPGLACEIGISGFAPWETLRQLQQVHWGVDPGKVPMARPSMIGTNAAEEVWQGSAPPKPLAPFLHPRGG